MTHNRNKAATIWTLAITSVALFMVSLDNLVVTTALPVIRRDLHATISQLEWTVNAYTLTFAVLLLTGAALGDRFGRRRMFVLGIAPLHGRLRARRALELGERARHRPRAPGRRRRDRHAAHADDPLRGGAAGAARARARHLGRHRRPRDRDRPARRRRDRQRRLVALDLLAQRADRARARSARLPPARGDARRRAQPRPARPRRSPAPACSASSGASCAATRTAGRASASCCRSSPASLLVAAFVALGAARERADAADAVLPQPHVRADERRVALHVLRDVRLDLPARAVLPDRAGLLAAAVGPADPAVDGDADLRRADRGCALRSHRRPAADGASA